MLLMGRELSSVSLIQILYLSSTPSHMFFGGLQESMLGRVLPVSAVASPSLRQ